MRWVLACLIAGASRGQLSGYACRPGGSLLLKPRGHIEPPGTEETEREKDIFVTSMSCSEPASRAKASREPRAQCQQCLNIISNAGSQSLGWICRV